MNKKITCLALVLSVFSLSAKSQVANTKKIEIINFTVHEKTDRIYFEWETDGKTATNNFEVQESRDGQEFTTIALVLGSDPQQQADRYKCKRLKIGEKEKPCSYRLCHVSPDGERQFSEILIVTK